MDAVRAARFLGFQRTLQGLADSWLVQLGVVGLLAMLLAATVVGVTYLVLFRQFERLMLLRRRRQHHGGAPIDSQSEAASVHPCSKAPIALR